MVLHFYWQSRAGNDSEQESYSKYWLKWSTTTSRVTQPSTQEWLLCNHEAMLIGQWLAASSCWLGLQYPWLTAIMSLYHTFFFFFVIWMGSGNNFWKPSQVLFNFLSWIESLMKYPVKGLGSVIKYDKIIVMITDQVRNFTALNFVFKVTFNFT